MTQPKIRAAVAGASGYAGAELVRLLLGHPGVELTAVYASAEAKPRPLSAALPALAGMSALTLLPLPASAAAWGDVDLIFLALPHGAAIDLIERLPRRARVIDLSGDFRLRDGAVFRDAYGREPPAADMQNNFIYSLPELRREKNALTSATHVASPGCFATACILALAPLVALNLVEPRIILDAKTGSSGAGAKPAPTTHHPERASSFFAYKMFRHQHLPEIRQALTDLAPAWDGSGLVLQAHATPLVRGIFISAYLRLRPEISAEAVSTAFHDFYRHQPFIRLSGAGASPNVAWSRGSNFVDIGWDVQGRDLVVFSALDNLGKGAASQALQSMNLMYGRPETEGLWQVGGCP